MTKILVTGASGLFGQSLCPSLDRQGFEVICPRFDLTQREETYAQLEILQPDAIVNLVALTSVDECENQPERAELLNARSVDNIAQWLRANSRSFLVQISTDQVYKGKGPHIENSADPVNIYARTKLQGERYALEAGACVLRTNLFGRSLSPQRKSFTDWLYEKLSTQEAIQLFTDVLFTPLRMETIAEMVGLVLQGRAGGVYNVGSRDGMSKCEFAEIFAQSLNLSVKHVERTISDHFPFAAKRPKDMRMDSSLFETTFRVKLPGLRAEVLGCGREYESAAK